MSTDEYRAALAGLLRCCEPPAPRVVSEFVAAVGPVDAWNAIVDRCAPTEVMIPVMPRLGSLNACELRSRAADDVQRAGEAGATLIGHDDPDWPEDCFAELAWVRPFEQCRTAAPPLALYRRGPHWPIRPRGAVAIVGSRAATPYGARASTELAAAASDDRYTVVSGAAFGIDAAAHRGALAGTDSGAAATTAPTIAVLACGIDRPYPAAHRGLLDAVTISGSVVSEYPPGSVPARHRFLVRNRLIASLAEATVVVEAGRRSGSLNTATTANNLGRTVAALPGPVTSAMSVGCHDLIRDNKAVLVASWADIAELLGPLAPAAPSHRIGHRPTDGLDLVASQVHEALPAANAASVDELAVEAALPVRDVLGALAILQIEGLVDRRDGRWSRVRTPS